MADNVPPPYNDFKEEGYDEHEHIAQPHNVHPDEPAPPTGTPHHEPAHHAQDHSGSVSPEASCSPERRTTLGFQRTPSRSGMKPTDAQGQPVVDDSYYDGKWWRKSSYSKLMALDAKPHRHPHDGVDNPGTTGSHHNGHDGHDTHDGPITFSSSPIGEEPEPNERVGLLAPVTHNHNDEYDEKEPHEKVRFMLTHEPKGEKELATIELRALFCQMDVLCHFDDGALGWKEAARWLKYEEKVEAGDRWSKPHVPTTSLHELFELRRCVAENTCSIILDMDASHGCLHQVAELISHVLQQERGLTDEAAGKITEVLVKPHKHKHRKGHKGKDVEAKSKNKPNGDIDAAGKKTKTKKGFGKKQDSSNETSALYYSYPGGMRPEDLTPHKPNKVLMRKIPGGSEAANIMVGQVDFLSEPIMAFIRLKNSSVLGDLTEVAVPTRFMFLLLGPSDVTSATEYGEAGRAMAAMFADKVFCEVAYKASTRQDLLDGMDEYIDDLTVLPPSIWDPSTRLEPPDETISTDKIRRRLLTSSRHAPDEEAFHLAESAGGDDDLKRTGRLFGGLWKDIKHRYPQYWTDIKDGLHLQCFASIVFLYFACVTPIVTFGGLLGQATDNYMGTMETMLAGAICGLIWHTFSGQPLSIMGATGPLLIFEGILYSVSMDFGFEYLNFRFYVGAWVFLILLLMVAFDLSAMVAYITRFTEESFSVLISLIFIAEAFKKLLSIWSTHPIYVQAGKADAAYKCHCEHPLAANSTEDIMEPVIASNTSEYMVDINGWHIHEDCVTYQHRVIVDVECIVEEDCTAANWTLTGSACGVFSVTHSVPDVFFLCCFLFIGTFVIAYFFRTFRTSTYFPSVVRTTLGDFAVLIAILTCTAIDFFMALDTPKLEVPTTITPTRSDRAWLVDPLAMTAWYIPLVAIIPALLATILIFLDQQITGVIVNRKEHKLKKGHGYHLDLLVLAFSILICSFLGLPWFVAATVRAITHVRSLIKESELRAPGERPQMLGVREQRVTGIGIHILIGLSVFLTGVLQYVPMAVLYGVFLYMGITSLAGVQFVERILILLMPSKYQPDHIYLRHVQTSRVHIFTIIQITCMVCMWIVKSTKSIAILFPVMLIFLCILRKIFDFIFTQRELFWLDHLLPDAHRREKEDKAKDMLSDKEMEKMGADDWDEFTDKRDFGNNPRQRKRSEGVITRYRNEKKGDTSDSVQKDENLKGRARGESFRERKFSM